MAFNSFSPQGTLGKLRKCFFFLSQLGTKERGLLLASSGIKGKDNFLIHIVDPHHNDLFKSGVVQLICQVRLKYPNEPQLEYQLLYF